jgi:hypothetical protein
MADSSPDSSLPIPWLTFGLDKLSEIWYTILN